VVVGSPLLPWPLSSLPPWPEASLPSGGTVVVVGAWVVVGAKVVVGARVVVGAKVVVETWVVCGTVDVVPIGAPVMGVGCGVPWTSSWVTGRPEFRPCPGLRRRVRRVRRPNRVCSRLRHGSFSSSSAMPGVFCARDL